MFCVTNRGRARRFAYIAVGAYDVVCTGACMVVDNSVNVFSLQLILGVNQLFAEGASCPHSGRYANLLEVADERLCDARVVR